MSRRILALAAALVLGTAAAQTVHFGYVEWPGVTVKTRVAADVLGALGYKTDAKALSVPIVLKGIDNGDLDVFLGVWRPSMNAMLKPYLGDGTGLELAATNLQPTLYRPAVPSYVAKQGIHSLADVAAHADMFDHKAYGIEPGNDGNKLLLDMITNDTYGWSDMHMVASSTQGMLSQVKRAVDRKEPIVFLAWSPHWMNAVYDLTYLDDPQQVWGGNGTVSTAVNSEYMAAHPDLESFFSKMKVDPDTQNAWIDAYSRQGEEADKVARQWIAAHLDEVSRWTQGMTATDGTPAAQALTAAFGS